LRTILHLIETTGPGGAESVFLDLATRLRRDAYRSIAGIMGPGWVHDTLVDRGVKPLILPARAAEKKAFNFHLYSCLTGLCRDHSVDLIHAHNLGLTVYAALVGLTLRLPVISTLHGLIDIEAGNRYRRLKSLVLRRGLSSLVVVSEHLRERLTAVGAVPADQIEVIYNGVDTALFQTRADRALRMELGIGDEVILAGSVGNIRPPKAYEVLLAAAAMVAQNSRRIHFVIVGEGSDPLLSTLEQQRRNLGLEGVVTFAGFRRDIELVLPSFDLFILSSRSEGFSIATIQAMACGIPVVATRSGGPEEIITDGETGLLVPVDDPHTLAAMILQLANDAGLRKRLATAALHSVGERFSLDKMLARYDALYRRALNS